MLRRHQTVIVFEVIVCCEPADTFMSVCLRIVNFPCDASPGKFVIEAAVLENVVHSM